MFSKPMIVFLLLVCLAVLSTCHRRRSRRYSRRWSRRRRSWHASSKSTYRRSRSTGSCNHVGQRSLLRIIRLPPQAWGAYGDEDINANENDPWERLDEIADEMAEDNSLQTAHDDDRFLQKALNVGKHVAKLAGKALVHHGGKLAVAAALGDNDIDARENDLSERLDEIADETAEDNSRQTTHDDDRFLHKALNVGKYVAKHAGKALVHHGGKLAVAAALGDNDIDANDNDTSERLDEIADETAEDNSRQTTHDDDRLLHKAVNVGKHVAKLTGKALVRHGTKLAVEAVRGDEDSFEDDLNGLLDEIVAEAQEQNARHITQDY